MTLPPDSAPAPGRRRAALIFIFITVLIDVLSFGVIIPVLPGLVRHFTGGDYVQAAAGSAGSAFCSPPSSSSARRCRARSPTASVAAR